MADVGILALQGDFAAHGTVLRRLGARPREVRVEDDLAGCRALVIPGGESTTLRKLLRTSGLLEAIPAFHRDGGALFGTCAGAILLARRVIPEGASFDLIDADVERNAYGRQRESFEATVEPADGSEPYPMLFIRAPIIRRVGPEVEVLAAYHGRPVLARHGRVWICTGHPELTGDDRVHRNFLKSLEQDAAAPSGETAPVAGAL